MDEQKIKEISRIVREIIEAFNDPKVASILGQMSEEEQKLLNPFHGFVFSGAGVNYKDLFRLASEIENYKKINWKIFLKQPPTLAARIYEKNKNIGEELREKVLRKLNDVEELIEKPQ